MRTLILTKDFSEKEKIEYNQRRKFIGTLPCRWKLTFHKLEGPSTNFAFVPVCVSANCKHSVPNSKSSSVLCEENPIS